MADKTIQWLLECDEPWTRYRTQVDLLGQPETDSGAHRPRRNAGSPAGQAIDGRGRRVAWATSEAAQ